MFKYKDRNPIETVNLIKNMFNIYNIEIDENWYNENSSYPSVRLTIRNTTLGSNGKGKTKAYALASAYAELMERIYNNGFFLNTNKSVNNNLTINNRKFIKKFKLDIKNIECFKKDYSYKNFKSLISNDKFTLSSNFLYFTYGTNGMYFGNTMAEGVSQGIFEILERYVIKKVLKGEIFGRFVKQDELDLDNLHAIHELEKIANSKITVIDYSMDTDFPVCCIILLNESGYYIKFGSHAILNYAVSRCLTEMVQGRNLQKLGGQNTCELDFKYTERNFLNIVENGHGSYPISILLKNIDGLTKFVDESSIKNNTDIYNYLINLLKKKKYDIFLNEYKNDNFSVGQVIIPSISEICINNKYELLHYNNINRINLTFENGNYNEFCKYVYRDLVKFGWRRYGFTVESFFGKNFGKREIGKINLNLFFASIAVKENNYKLGYKYLEEYKEDLSRRHLKMNMYYYCMAYYLYTKIKKSEKSFPNTAINYYSNDLISDIYNNFQSEDELKVLFFCNKTNVINTYDSLLRLAKLYDNR